jgi:hypothetical protein
MGCAEGQSPYAGSLRVSLRYTFFYSPKIGGQGVDTDGARVSQQNDPSSRASNHILADVKKER